MTKWLKTFLIAITLVCLLSTFVSPNDDPILVHRARSIQRFAFSHNLRTDGVLYPVLSHQPLIPIIWASLGVLPVLYFVGKIQNPTFSPQSACPLDVSLGRAPPTILPA